MDHVGDGHTSLGLDGVLRSYAGNGTVIDWRQLDPTQIAEYVGFSHPLLDTRLKRSAESYGDGRDVTDISQLCRFEPKHVSANVSSVEPVDAVGVACSAALGNAGPQQDSEQGENAIPCKCIYCDNDNNCWLSNLANNCVRCGYWALGSGICLEW